MRNCTKNVHACALADKRFYCRAALQIGAAIFHRNIWRAVRGACRIKAEKEKEVVQMKRVFMAVLVFILALMAGTVACSGNRRGCSACDLGCAACTACTVISCLDTCADDGM